MSRMTFKITVDAETTREDRRNIARGIAIALGVDGEIVDTEQPVLTKEIAKKTAPTKEVAKKTAPKKEVVEEAEEVEEAVTIIMIREKVSDLIDSSRDEIKAELARIGVENVMKLSKAQYEAFYAFLNGLQP